MNSHSAAMAVSPQAASGPEFVSRARVLDELARIQRAAHKITSTLDLDLLIDQVVNEVARTFGCTETSIFLRDFDANEMVLAGVQGGTMHGKGARLRIGKQGMVPNLQLSFKHRVTDGGFAQPTLSPVLSPSTSQYLTASWLSTRDRVLVGSRPG
jgi:hypothetical protein